MQRQDNTGVFICTCCYRGKLPLSPSKNHRSSVSVGGRKSGSQSGDDSTGVSVADEETIMHHLDNFCNRIKSMLNIITTLAQYSRYFSLCRCCMSLWVHWELTPRSYIHGTTTRTLGHTDANKQSLIIYGVQKLYREIMLVLKCAIPYSCVYRLMPATAGLPRPRREDMVYEESEAESRSREEQEEETEDAPQQQHSPASNGTTSAFSLYSFMNNVFITTECCNMHWYVSTILIESPTWPWDRCLYSLTANENFQTVTIVALFLWSIAFYNLILWPWYYSDIYVLM